MRQPQNFTTYPSRPAWLEEGSLPLSLLERFISRIEKGQRLCLRVSPRTAPDLYDFQHEDVQYLWELLKWLDKEFHILSIEPARVKSNQEVYENARICFNPEKEELVRHWLDRPALDPYALVWKNELQKMAEQFEDGGQALVENIIRVPEQGPEQTLRGFARAGSQLRRPITLRALSARCFWGDSRFLDRHEELLRTLYPEKARNLIPRAVLTTVCMPVRIEEILFVENQESFLALSDQQIPGLVVVYSGGFRGSAQRLREPRNTVFAYLGSAEHQQAATQFHDWWYGRNTETMNCWFWGDLDFAAMSILKALRRTFPNMQAWAPGYRPMLDMLQQHHGHNQEAVGQFLQPDPGSTGCAWADSVLLPLMRETGGFIDQEAVDVEQIQTD